MKLKTFTIEDIRSWNPCYDPATQLPEGWGGNALDILKRNDVSVDDRFWVVLRKNIIDDKTLRLFAVWCARQVQHLMKDPRSVSAIDMAEDFAKGEASIEDLNAARAATRASAQEAQVSQLIKMLEAGYDK